jgi:hypothetical protein
MVPDLALARRALLADPPPGRLLVCAVSGAHLYGFPSPDSDLDLKGMHQLPTTALVGIGTPELTHDVQGWREDVEIDLTTQEVGKALALLLAGNGNTAEQILSPYQVVETPWLPELRQLAVGALSRRFARHYRGFFLGCRREFQRQPSVKSLLYSYRVALTGIHLLHTGELVAHLPTLADRYALEGLMVLVARKAEVGEHAALDPDEAAEFVERWAWLEAELVAAESASVLPPEAANRLVVERWLVELRRQALVPQDGAQAIVFDGEGRVLLGHRRDRDEWDLPGGGILRGEAPWAAAVRETLEKTGVEVAVTRLVGMYQWPLPRGHRGFVFVAEWAGGAPRPSSETDEVAWFRAAALPATLPPHTAAFIRRAAAGADPPELLSLPEDPYADQWLG